MNNIRYVDGFLIRNTLDLEFSLIHQYGISITAIHRKFYIPKDEIWIDNIVREETDFLVKSEVYFDRPEVKEELAKNEAEGRTFDEKRSVLKKLCLPPPVPIFEVKREPNEKLDILYVDGSMIRKYFDPEWSFGGHDLVYSYIPKGQIWIDILIDPKEIKYILQHELSERNFMDKEGKDYNIAHDYASVEEKESRIKDGVGSYPLHYDVYMWKNLSEEEIINKYYVR